MRREYSGECGDGGLPVPVIEGDEDPMIGEPRGVPGPLLSYNSNVICVRSSISNKHARVGQSFEARKLPLHFRIAIRMLTVKFWDHGFADTGGDA